MNGQDDTLTGSPELNQGPWAMQRNATSLFAITLIFWTIARTYAVDVRGLVKMPSFCSSEISPAVIWL